MRSQTDLPGVPGDRRKPVARYVEFGDADTQERFIALAEAAHQVLTSADTFEGVAQVEVQTAPAPERRLFRKSQPAPSERVSTTPALSRVIHGSAEARTASRPCRCSERVAHALTSVVRELALDLLGLSPSEQAEHPAYRQTLRLSAELTAFGDLMSQVGCSSRDGCVGVRLPEHWGRRVEDVEVAEVRSVLHKLTLVSYDDA